MSNIALQKRAGSNIGSRPLIPGTKDASSAVYPALPVADTVVSVGSNKSDVAVQVCNTTGAPIAAIELVWKDGAGNEIVVDDQTVNNFVAGVSNPQKQFSNPLFPLEGETLSVRAPATGLNAVAETVFLDADGFCEHVDLSLAKVVVNQPAAGKATLIDNVYILNTDSVDHAFEVYLSDGITDTLVGNGQVGAGGVTDQSNIVQVADLPEVISDGFLLKFKLQVAIATPGKRCFVQVFGLTLDAA